MAGASRLLHLHDGGQPDGPQVGQIDGAEPRRSSARGEPPPPRGRASRPATARLHRGSAERLRDAPGSQHPSHQPAQAARAVTRRKRAGRDGAALGGRRRRQCARRVGGAKKSASIGGRGRSASSGAHVERPSVAMAVIAGGPRRDRGPRPSEYGEDTRPGQQSDADGAPPRPPGAVRGRPRRIGPSRGPSAPRRHAGEPPSRGPGPGARRRGRRPSRGPA